MAERFVPREGQDDIKERTARQMVFRYGREFAVSYPTIIEDARAGLSLKEIAGKYRITSLYNVTEVIAHSIVKNALQLLLSPEDRATIYGERLAEAYREAGKNSLENKTGIFSLNAAQRQEASRKAGKVSGPLAYEKGLAIFGLAPEELRERQRKGALKRPDSWFGGVIIGGKSEGEYVLWALQQPEFKIMAGSHKGRPDYTKITQAVNQLYGKNRSRAAVKGVGENQKRRKDHP